ncbi:MAG: hypothetical protein V4563_15915 [Pseudomonadota bacterium]
MKLTPFARNLLGLCRKMRAWNWELVSNSIRRPNPGPIFQPEHCPLSYCGDAHGIDDMMAGGRNLGFTPSESVMVAQAADFKWSMNSYKKTRRILLRAAKLKSA